MSITQEQANKDNAIPEEKPSGGKFTKLIATVSGLVVGLALLTVLGVTFYTLATEITWVKDGTGSIIYPVQGERAVIADAETFWVKKGHNNYLPASKVRLSKKSKQGTLRLIYVNERDRMVGKPHSEDFQDGKFENGKSISLIAEEGLTNEGTLNAYLTDQADSWYLTVLEGPKGSDSTSEYKEIARIPIERTLKK